MTEIWKDIPGLEGAYEVSNYGRVRSLSRICEYYRLGTLCKRQLPERILSAGSTSGYYMVSLALDGEHIVQYVHRLVAEAFIGSPSTGQLCVHINRDRKDNSAKNLRWATQSEYMQRDIADGVYSTPARRAASVKNLRPVGD